MPTFEVRTPHSTYSSVVRRGILSEAAKHVPAKAGSVFVITTEDVWRFHGHKLEQSLNGRAA
jgi:hypothetical protein